MSAIADKTKIPKDLFRVLERDEVKSAGRKKTVKSDMKAFAEQVRTRLKKQYGTRVTPDSVELMEHLRSDASCPSVSTPHSS